MAIPILRSPLLRPLLRPLLALTLASLAACGPGGNNDLAIPTHYSGQVNIPVSSTLGKPSLLARAAHWLLPAAAAVSDLQTAGTGVTVSLYAIDRHGLPAGPVLAQAVTDSSGQYILRLPSWDLYNPSAPWVVAVGSASNGTLMRRWVDDLPGGTGRDIEPATEAAVRLVIQDPASFSIAEITPQEFSGLTDLVLAASSAVIGLTIEESAARALLAAQDNAAVQNQYANATSSAQNHRPQALAGVDARVTTGETLNLLGAAEDTDDTLFQFNWSLDSAPAGSALQLGSYPVGSHLAFSPDVDGTYRLKLLVTDTRGFTSPSDFTNIIATTAPLLLTDNSYTDSQGHIDGAATHLAYTTAISSGATTSNLDVRLKTIGSAAPPVTLYPPGAKDGLGYIRVEHSIESSPAIPENGVLAVFQTDFLSQGVGGSDFEIIAVPLAFPDSPLYITNNLDVDIQPDVQCQSATTCTVIYVTDADGDEEIIAADLADPGTGFAVVARRQLTYNTTGDFQPRLSLDGTWVIYVGQDPTCTDSEIFRIRTDGSMSQPERLTVNTADDRNPEPDRTGAHVVIERTGQIWNLNTATLAQTRISDPQPFSITPSISGDGQKVVFIAETGFGTDLFIANGDGTGRVQLTADGTVSQPHISPDGTHILFRSARQGDHDIYLR